jgi:hypothetical protein
MILHHEAPARLLMCQCHLLPPMLCPRNQHLCPALTSPARRPVVNMLNFKFLAPGNQRVLAVNICAIAWNSYLRCDGLLCSVMCVCCVPCGCSVWLAGWRHRRAAVRLAMLKHLHAFVFGLCELLSLPCLPNCLPVVKNTELRNLL